MSLIKELKRRNVFRVAIGYLITAWLIMQVGDTMVPALHLPEWADSLLAFFLILGFPVALFFAWAFELTPEGFKREHDSGDEDKHRALARAKLNRSIFVVMAMALIYFAVDKFVFDQPVPVSTAVNASLSTDAEKPADRLIPDKSIAVLPFVNMSSDPEQEYFSDGLTEELLNLLAGIKELKVAARTSSFYYKDKLDSVPLTEIAAQLDVAHVLEGSVRKSGNKIRITAQLIKADDGYHLWSETYDRNLDDVFTIQDEIAAAVVNSLRITLLGEAPQSKVLNTESYELTLQGRFLFNRRNDGDLERALELFERALQLDPENASAWVGLVPLYLWLFDPPDNIRALEAAEKAVALEPENPEAHIRLATALFNTEDRTRGKEELSRATKLGEHNPLVLSVLSGIAGYYGDLDKMIELQTRAVAEDPLHIVNLGNLGNFQLYAGQLDLAEKTILKLLELAPGNDGGLESLATIRLLQGNFQEAKQLMDQVQPGQRPGTLTYNKLRLEAMIQHSLGNQQASDAALAEFKRVNGESNAVDVASIFAWRGEPDEAFKWLEQALVFDEGLSIEYSWDPFLASLHSDPRWNELIARWRELFDKNQ